MNNNLTGLQQKTNPNTNEVNAVRQLDPGTSGINMDYIANNEIPKTQLEKDAEVAQGQAIRDYVAGLPEIQSPSLTIAPKKPDIDTTVASTTFTTRDQIMSRLGLMDENGNYTDTYTNYVNQGGAPLPGYEYAHQELLDQERYDQIFQKVDNGEMSYDTALMEAYGQDIMATMGYDVTSVAYWKNKYSNSDFSNPFANRYLMDQVKQAAEEYHKSRQAGQFGKSRVSESQIAQLVGEELSAKQIKDIFGDIGTYAKDQQIEDEDLIKQCLSGSIDARYRLRQIDETHFAFLHTDGKLHTLEKGKDIIFDSNGNIKEISVNGSTGMDGLDHFLAAFTQIVPTVGKLGALLISIPDIFTNNMEAVTDRLQAIDAWANSDSLLSDLYRLDHIDMDGFNFEGKDILMTSCDILGMLAGNWAVGKIATLGTSMGQLMVDAGAKTGNVALKGLGQAAGTLTKGVSSLALRSTGWYSGVNNPTAFTMFGKELVKPSVLGMWLNHGLKVAPIYAMKDYYNSVSQMNQTNISLMLQGKDAAFTQEDINERALKATGINYGLNMLFASAQGLTSMERFGLNKQTHNWDIIRSRYTDNKLNALAQKMAEGIESPAFRKYMMATKNIIGLNSMGDIFATVAGNQIQAWQTATTEDGKAYKGSLIDFLTGDSSLGGELGKNVLARKGFWKDLVQTSIMQASEYARNKREAKLYYYSGINMLGMAHSQYMTKLQEQIDKTSDPAQRDALQTIKNHQLQMVNDPKNGDTVEQRILKAMDYECQQIGDMPPELKKIFDNLITNDKQEYYKLLGETIEYGRKYFKDNVKQDKLNALGDKKHLWNKVGSVKDRLTNYLRGNTFKGQDAQKLAFLKAYEDFNQTTIDQYYQHTGQLTANKLLAQALTPENIKFDDIIEMSDEYKDRISPDYPNEAYFIYKIKQEAELNESASKYDQPRLKGKVFRTTMDLLAEETPGAVIKLDDNTYAMFSALDPITESFTLDTQRNLNHALLMIHDDPSRAANIITATLLGDEAYNAEDMQPHYDSLTKVLTFATKNGLMSDVEASDLLWRIAEEPDTSDKKMTEISNKMHDYLTSKVFDPSSKSTLSGASDIEKCLRVRNALSILSSKPKGTTAFNAAWNLIIDKDNKLTDVANKVLEYYDPTFKQRVLPTLLKDGGGRFPLSDAYLSEELLTPVNKEIGAKVITSSDEEIALYYKKANKDKFKVFFAEKDKLLKDYDDNTVKHEASGTIVSINLAGFSGKSFKKAFSIYKAQKEAHQTEGTYINHDVLKNDTGMISEYKAKADLAQEFDSTVLNFDLNDPTQFETFKDVARTLKLFGDNDSDYTYMTLDSAKKNLRNLKDGWDNDVEFNDGLLSYVKLDDKVQNKLIKNFKDIKFEKAKPIYYDKDGNEHVYDLPDKIAQVAEIHKVSSKVRRIKNADEDGNISILALPFGKKKDTKSYASIEYAGEGERGKQGTQSKKATGGISFDALESADEYERNRDLGSYYYIRNLIDKADDRTYRFSYYGDTDKIEKKLTSLNIIGNSGFYEVDPVASADGMLTIRLKADAQERMLDYLETSNQDDFNLFRIIPLISDKPQGKVTYLGSDIKEGKISYIDKDGNKQIAEIPDMYNGSSKYEDNGLQIIYNTSAAFDEDGTLKSYILGSMASQNSEGNYFFNPFTSKKISSRELKQKIYEAYLNNDVDALATYNDYEAEYLKNVLDTINEFTSDSTDEDFKVILQNDKVVKYLIDNFDTTTGNFKVSMEELTNGVKNAYIQAHAKNYGVSSVDYDFSSQPYSARRYSSVPDAYALNESILNKISGDRLYIDVEDPNDVEYINKVITQAIDTFKTVATQDDTATWWMKPDTVNIFQENNVTRVLQSIAGNEGYLTIQDADEISRFTEEQLSYFADALGLKQSEVKLIKTQADYMAKFLVKAEDNLNKSPYEIKQYVADVGGSVPSVTGKTITTTDNTLNKMQRDLLDSQGRKENKDTIINLPDAVYEDGVDKLTGETNKAPDDALFVMNYYNKKADDMIRRKFNSPYSAEVYNMESTFAVQQMKEVRTKTLERVKELTNDPNAQANIVDDMYYSALQVTRDKEWQQFKVYNSQGNDILEGAFNGRNFFEIFEKLNTMEYQDGLTFVQLKRQALDSYDGVDFSYKKLDRDALNELKQYFASRALDSYIDYRGGPDDTYETFRNKLLDYQQNDPSKYKEIMMDIARTQTSKQSRREQVMRNMTDRLFDSRYSTKRVFDSIIPPVIASRRFGNEGINNYLKNLNDAMDSDNNLEVADASLVNFGIHINSLTELEAKNLKASRDSLLNTLDSLNEDTRKQVTEIASYGFNSDNYKTKLEDFLNNPEINEKQKVDALKLIIASSKDASALAYRTSGVFFDTLKDVDKLKETSMPSLTYITQEGTRKQMLLSNIDKSRGVDYDLEGIIPDDTVIKTGTIKDIFQASFIWTNKDGSEEVRNIFITHGMTPEEYADKMHLTTNSYYKKGGGYKDSVDQYVHHDTSGNAVFMTEEEFESFLGTFSNKTFYAYNGSGYDFDFIRPYVKRSNNFLDAIEFNNMLDPNSSINAKTLSANAKRDLDNIEDLTNAHNAEADTRLLKLWRENRIDSFIDPTINAKQRLVRVVEDYAKHSGLDSNELFNELDTTFKQLYDDGDFQHKFRQGMLDASDSTYLARQLNHLNESNLGFAIRQFMNDDQIYIDSGFGTIKDALKQGTYLNKVLDVVAERMLDNPDITAKQAWANYSAEVYSSVDEDTYINPSKEVLNYEVDPTVKNTKEFQEILKELKTKNQKPGSRFSFISTTQDYEDNKFYGISRRVVNDTEDLTKGFTFKTSEVKDWMEDQFLTFLSSTKEGRDQFYYETKEVINSKDAQKTLDVLRANYGDIKGLMFFNRDGIFKRVLPLTAGENMFTTLSYNPKTGYMSNVGKEEVVNADSTTLVVDRLAFKQMCKGNYEDVFDDEGNAYATVLRQPSAYKGSKQFYKIKVVEGNQGSVYLTPAMWRALFSGDFDGDSASIVPITSKTGKALAKFSTDNLSLAGNIQENLMQEIYETSSTGGFKFRKQDRSKLFDILALSKQEEILNVSREIDNELKKTGYNLTDEQYNEFKNKFINAFETLVKDKKSFYDISAEDVWDNIGVKRGSNYAYVRNWEIMADPESFSFKQALIPNLTAASEKTNAADSMAGFYKQRFLYPAIETNLGSDPLLKLDLYGSRIGEELEGDILNIDWLNSKNSLDNYFGRIQNTIASNDSIDPQYAYKLNESITDIKNDIESSISTMRENKLSEADINDKISRTVLAETYQILTNINGSLRTNESLNNKLTDIFSTITPDDDFRKQLDSHLKYQEMLKNLQRQDVKVSGDSMMLGDDSAIEDIIFNQMEKETSYGNRTKFVKSIADVFPNSVVTVAVIDDNGFDVDGARDTMFINNNTNLRHIKQAIDLTGKQAETLFNLQSNVSDNNELYTLANNIEGDLTKKQLKLLESYNIETENKTNKEIKKAIHDKIKENKQQRISSIKEAIQNISYENKNEILRELEHIDSPGKKGLIKIINNLQEGEDITIASNSQDNKFTLLLRESVVGKKGLSIGKGMLKGFNIAKEVSSDNNFDVLLTSDGLSRLNKLAPGTRFGEIETIDNIDVNVGGRLYQNRRVKLIKNVPFVLLENFNQTVEGKPQKTDLMTLLANQGSLVDLAETGSVTLKRNKNGTFTYSNKELADYLDESNESRNISWNNGAGIELIGRNMAQINIIEKNNLWPKFNEYKDKILGYRTPPIKDAASFEKALTNFSPASLEMYNLSESLTRFLISEGYTTEGLLKDMTPQERACFSKQVQDWLDYQISGKITNTDNPWIESKHQAHGEVEAFRNLTKGQRINPSQEEYSGKTQRYSSEHFYMPMNRVYNNHTGYSINYHDALDLANHGLTSYAIHAPSSFIDGFAPIADKRYSFEVPEGMMDRPYLNDPKAGQVANPDRDIKAPLPESVFGMISNNPKIGAYAENRARGTLNVTLGKEAINAPTKVTQDGLLFNSLINRDNTIDAVIEASRRNIAKDITFNGFGQKLDYTDDGLAYTLIPETRKGTYSYLKKGEDFKTGQFNFYSIKDIYNKVNQTDLDIKDTLNIKDQKQVTAKDISQEFQNNADIFASARSRNNENLNLDIEFDYGKDNVDTFKTSYFQSSGIHIGKEDTGDTIAVAMGIENKLGQENMIIADGNEYLSNIKRTVTDNQAFIDYCKFEGLQALEANGEDITDMLNYLNVDRKYYETTMKQNHDLLNSNQSFVSAMTNYINYSEQLSKKVAELYHDPFAGMAFDYLSAFVPSDKHKDVKYKYVYNAIANTLEFGQFKPKTREQALKSNMIYDFFEANKAKHTAMAKMIAVENITTQLHQRQLLDNATPFNQLTKYLSNSFDVSKLYLNKEDLKSPEFKEAHDTIMNVVRMKTDIDVDRELRAAKGNPVDQIKVMWNATTSRLGELQEELQNAIGKDLNYTELKYAIATNGLSRENIILAQKTFDAMTAQILLGQRIVELSPKVANDAAAYINSVYKSGYVFANKQGQKIARDSHIKPIGETDTGWLVDNIEIAANNQSEAKFNQFLIEKALRGELYLIKSDLADQLAEKVYTKKTDGWLLSNMKKISGISASIQMMMPLKMLGRVTRFTGTDYGLGATYSLKTIPNMERAAKELSAAIYSKGATVKPGTDLYEYLIREGQPLNVTNKDPITFQEDIEGNIGMIADKLTKPLAYQNHFGRYAIWLTAKESFDNNDPIYGPTYYLHNQIDTLQDNKDKATFIMDHMIGSPGGFPYLSKKTNGLMMFATFPMNLSRTAGAYAMSIGQLFQEGVTSENAPQWIKTVASPSAAVIIMGSLSSMFISAICDKYGIDEKNKKKWIEEQVTIDPLGTILGGTPSVTFDSINPYSQLKELYWNPWVSEYNRTLGDKALGFLSATTLSKLNPALKIPTEVLIQKDFNNGSLMDTSKAYTRYENGLRKVFGFMFGSGVANGVVDQLKIDQYDKDSNFANSIWKGMTKGFANDIGNQKSWKKDTSNYYAMIDRLSAYKYAKSEYKDATYVDLTDQNYLKEKRSYTKSYGDYDAEQYAEVNKMLRKMIKEKQDPTTIYTYIAEMYNKGVSEATLRRALNNNSIIRKLNSVDKADFYRTLSSKELENLEKALRWEESTYDLLKDFFPNNPYYNYIKAKRTKYYNNDSSGGSYYPKTYYPKKAPQVNYYPNNGYSNKKLSVKNPKASINRVQVKVSPEMAVWTRDYNKTKELRHWKDSDYNRTKPLSHGGGK